MATMTGLWRQPTYGRGPAPPLQGIAVEPRNVRSVGLIASARSRSRQSITPNWFERLLALGAIAILVAVAAAIVRGHAERGRVPALIWLHLATIVITLVLTPVLLLRPRGVRLHRQLGYLWVGAMTATAAISFGIRTINPGGLSPIHVLSAFTLIHPKACRALCSNV